MPVMIVIILGFQAETRRAARTGRLARGCGADHRFPEMYRHTVTLFRAVASTICS